MTSEIDAMLSKETSVLGLGTKLKSSYVHLQNPQ